MTAHELGVGCSQGEAECSTPTGRLALGHLPAGWPYPQKSAGQLQQIVNDLAESVCALETQPDGSLPVTFFGHDPLCALLLAARPESDPAPGNPGGGDPIRLYVDGV